MFPVHVPRTVANYLDMNLNMAKYVCDRYYNEVLKDIDETRLVYPK